MVASPLEMVASIITLGGYSSAKSGRKAAMLAASEGAKAGLKQGATKAASAGGQRLDEILAAAAKEEGGEAAEGGWPRPDAEDAAQRQARDRQDKRSTEYLSKNYAAVRQKVLDKVY